MQNFLYRSLTINVSCYECMYLFFFIEQLNCWSSEKDQNQEVDFEIGGASGTKKVGGEFNIENHGAAEILLSNL